MAGQGAGRAAAQAAGRPGTSAGRAPGPAARPRRRTAAGRAPTLARCAGDHALLEPEEEAELARRWREQGDRRAFDRLLLSHLKLVLAIAARYRGHRLSQEDLVQEGVLGLARAIAKFRPDGGARLSTYAGWWVRSAIQEAVYRNASVVRPLLGEAHIRAFFQGGRPGEEAPLPLPSDLPLDGPAHDREARPLADLLADGRPDAEAWLATRREAGRTRQELAQALDTLTPRERQVIAARYLSDTPETLESLARTLGVTGERVRQIQAAALGKLRASLSRTGLSAVPAAEVLELA